MRSMTAATETVALLLLAGLTAWILLTPDARPHSHDGGRTFHAHPGGR